MRPSTAVLVAVAAAGLACEGDEAGPFLLEASIVEMPPVSVGGDTPGGTVPAWDARYAQARLFLGDMGHPLGVGVPGPVDGAEVAVRWSKDGTSSPKVALAYLAPADQGTLGAWAGPEQYLADSGRSALAYVEGADYTFEARYRGRTYTATVTAPARSLATLTGPLASGVTTFSSRAELPSPFTLERACPGGCPSTFVLVLPGKISWLSFTAMGLGRVPTCGNFPATAAALGEALQALDDAASAGPTLGVPGPECFDLVLNESPYDELFFPSIIAVRRGTVSPDSHLVAGSVVVAGVSASATIRIPDPNAPWNLR